MAKANGKPVAERQGEAKPEHQPERPVHEVRIGRIKAAIWAQPTQNGVRHAVKVSRIYMGQDEQWKTADTFGRDDLLTLAKVADLAHSWICENAKGSDVPC